MDGELKQLIKSLKEDIEEHETQGYVLDEEDLNHGLDLGSYDLGRYEFIQALLYKLTGEYYHTNKYKENK